MLRSTWRALIASVCLTLTGAAHTNEPLMLSWPDLMPQDWHPQVLPDAQELARLDDRDPRAMALMAELEQAWQAAPLVTALDGETVTLRGYALALEGDSRRATQFLLVPFFGACIHTPPPPRNQIVLANFPPGEGARIRYAFFPVEVTGTLSLGATSTPLAQPGYSLMTHSVTPVRSN